MILLHFQKEATAKDIDTPFNYSNAEDDLFGIILREIDLLLLGSLQESRDIGEFEIFSEVLELFALRIANVERLGEDTADVHIMFPNEVLHVMS